MAVATTSEKVCSKCEQAKPREQFGRASASKDGLFCYCKSCASENARNWHRDNPEKSREKDRRWRRENPEKVAAQARRNTPRHRARHPEKARARNILGLAVFDGRVAKPATCERCDRETEPIHLHGHHRDYSKPLEVRWLCRPCHEAVHRGA